MSQGGEDAAGQVVHSLRGRGEAEAHRGGSRHCHRCRLIFFCIFFVVLGIRMTLMRIRILLLL